MSFDTFPVRTSEPELVESVVKFVGGAAAVTKVFGKGLKISYIGTGLVDLIFVEPPGQYVGVVGRCFEATTTAALKGYTVVAGAWNTATNTLRLSITNAADALTDLAVLQWLTLKIAFKLSQPSL